MKFYHNSGLNLTAEEDWLVEYLCKYENQFVLYNDEEMREELHTCREVCGWYECEVSNTIEEALRYV
jgi:hypothetical protein